MVSKAKILAYYEDVVDSLVASGRVKFFWQSEYKGDGKFISMAKGGQEYQVRLIMNISVANMTKNPYVPSSTQSSQLHISISILKTLLIPPLTTILTTTFTKLVSNGHSPPYIQLYWFQLVFLHNKKSKS